MRVQGSGMRVQGSGFKVQGLQVRVFEGFRVHSPPPPTPPPSTEPKAPWVAWATVLQRGCCPEPKTLNPKP